jgi:hypothetical protein
MMQLSLLDPPVIELETCRNNPESSTHLENVSIAPTVQVGDSVRVLIAGEPLPSSLVGQVGIVTSLITPTIAQIDINGKLWGLRTAHLELVQTEVESAPKFEIQIDDRVLVSGRWWRVSERLESGIWMVDERVREPTPHTRARTLVSSSEIDDRRAKPAIVCWLEAKIEHRQRMFDRLEGKADQYKQRLANEPQPPSEYIDLYPLSPEELAEFTPEGQVEYQAICKEFASFWSLKTRLKMLEREIRRSIQEDSEIRRQIYDVWEEVCRQF